MKYFTFFLWCLIMAFISTLVPTNWIYTIGWIGGAIGQCILNYPN